VALIAIGGFAWQYLHPTVVTKKVEVPDPDPLVRGATQTLGFLCRDAVDLPKKEKGRYTAEQIGDSRLSDQFARQAAELRANIHDYAMTYQNHLLQLLKISKIDADKVRNALGKTDESASDFYRQ